MRWDIRPETGLAAHLRHVHGSVSSNRCRARQAQQKMCQNLGQATLPSTPEEEKMHVNQSDA
jgi:hypothetical protein